MSTNDLHLTAVLRCPDQRNTLALAFGSLEPVIWGLLEFPSMAATLPPGAAEAIAQWHVRKILVMVHGDLLTGLGCGARNALQALNSGGQLDVALAQRLPDWLKNNVDEVDPFMQAVYVSCKVSTEFQDAQILTVVFDQMSQTMYPVAAKIGENWSCIDRQSWEFFTNLPFESAVPALDIRELTGWMQLLLTMNRASSVEGEQIASKAGYESFRVRAIVLNSTPFAPDAYGKVRKVLGITSELESMAMPYYSVFCDPAYPDHWLPQVQYGLDHMAPGTRIITLGHTNQVVDLISGILERVPGYRDVVRKWSVLEYRFIVSQPHG